MLRTLALALTAFVVFFFTTFPAAAASGTPPTPLNLLVSIAPQKYILERIAGDAVNVTVLVSPGADPHAYEPSPSQMRAAESARAWFTFGVPFEDIWLPRISGTAPNLAIVSTTAKIRRLPAVHGEHDGNSGSQHPHGDPHIWLSPMLVRELLAQTARELGKLMPEKAAAFRVNARAFADELDALDREIADKFAAVPKEKRCFLSFHPSWRYFAYNYELNYLWLVDDGIKEPGARSMQHNTERAAAEGVRLVLVEPQFPKAAAEAVAEALGVPVAEADPLQEDLPALYRNLAETLAAAFAAQ